MGRPVSDYDYTSVVFTWRVTSGGSSQVIRTSLPDGYAIDMDHARHQKRRELLRQYSSVEEISCEPGYDPTPSSQPSFSSSSSRNVHGGDWQYCGVPGECGCDLPKVCAKDDCSCGRDRVCIKKKCDCKRTWMCEIKGCNCGRPKVYLG